MQNVRDYLTVKLHTTKKSALNAIAKPTYKNHTILSKNLVQTNHFTPVIKHDKPIAICVSILELVSIFYLKISLIFCLCFFILNKFFSRVNLSCSTFGITK